MPILKIHYNTWDHSAVQCSDNIKSTTQFNNLVHEPNLTTQLKNPVQQQSLKPSLISQF